MAKQDFSFALEISKRCAVMKIKLNRK